MQNDGTTRSADLAIEIKPLHQFEIHPLIPIHIGGLDLSVTKAVAYLLLGTLLTILFGPGTR